LNDSSKGILALLTTSFLWGCTPTVSKLGLESLPPLYFLGISYLIGGIILAFIFRKKLKFINKKIMFFSFFISIILASGSILEILGLKYITPMKSGLLMSFQTILIPIFCFLFFKTILELNDVISLVCASIGLILINHNGISFDFNFGVILTIVAAALFAIQTIIIGNLVKKYVPILITIVELLFTSIICLVFSLITERSLTHVSSTSILSLLFSGIFCSAIAFSLQTFGQKYVSPMHTGIIFAATPIFNIIISHAIHKNVLNLYAFIGSIIIVLAIINSHINASKLFSYKFKKAKQSPVVFSKS